jgi:hypothetical protein
MGSKFVLALLGCVIAGSCSAQAAPAAPAAPGKQQQINLNWQGGANYFPFPQGAQVTVSGLYCPPGVTVSVTCRTTARSKCGSWYLGLNQTAKAGADAETGIASLNYNGPANSNCSATLTVQSP